MQVTKFNLVTDLQIMLFNVTHSNYREGLYRPTVYRTGDVAVPLGEYDWVIRKNREISYKLVIIFQ